MTGRQRHVSFGLCALAAESLVDDRDGYQDALTQLMRLAELCEREGLDSAWLSEHHFAPDGYLPAPWVMLGALAQRTERITIGTSVLLAPLHDPLRVAEEVAVADQLSRGRVVVGLGLGYRPIEHRAFGRDPARRVAHLERTVDLLRRAWRTEPLAGVGLLEEDETVVVRPRPYRAGGPPIWIGSQVEPGIRRARRLGDGFIAGPETIGRFRRQLSWLGGEGPLDDHAVMTTVFGFVAAQNARGVARDAVEHVERSYRDYMAEARGGPPPGARSWNEGASHFMDQPNFFVGTPEECVDTLRPWHEALAALPGDAPAHLSVRLAWPGMGPEAEESVRLFAREVVPALRATAHPAENGVFR
jgi:alkanesulfonate monooxygenase SsuD/methylene tetrahydromethanopterin reductase-like flavin-dependent oxidoreductase (luciferase family)